MKKSIRNIKALPFIISYNDGYNVWEGRTENRMAEIIKQGYAEVYPAHSRDAKKMIYKATVKEYIPLHCILSVK